MRVRVVLMLQFYSFTRANIYVHTQFILNIKYITYIQIGVELYSQNGGKLIFIWLGFDSRFINTYFFLS